jgi:hypothetical protein
VFRTIGDVLIRIGILLFSSVAFKVPFTYRTVSTFAPSVPYQNVKDPEHCFTSVFKDKKSLRSNKAVESKVFLFCLPVDGSIQIRKNKYGSGSGTLSNRFGIA